MLRRFPKAAFILFLSLALLFSGGCSNTADKKEDFLTGNGGSDLNTNHKPVTLSFWFPGTQPKSWETVRNEIEKQISGTVNVKLDFKWFEYQDYMQKISTLSASNEVFDAFCCAKPQPYYPDFTKLAREGLIKDITKLFPEKAPSLYSKYTKQELEYAKVNGKLYAVPSLYPYAWCTYIMADDALLTKYGIQNINTLEDYEKFLISVKNDNLNLIPGTISNSVETLNLFSRGSGYVVLDQVQKLVYKWDDPEMKVTAWEKTPEFKEAVNYIVTWLKKGYIAVNPDITKTASFVYYDMLLPISNKTSEMGTTNDKGETKKSNPLRRFYLHPEKIVQRDNPMGSFYWNGSFVFSSNSENTDRALMFIDWVQENRSNYYLTMYGIENKDYVLKKGSPVLPDGMDFQNRTYLYWDGSWAFSNIEYKTSDIIKENDESNLKTFLDKYTKYPPHGSLYPDFSSLGSAAESRAASFMDFERRLSTGEIQDPIEIDNFIKELEDLGSDNLVETAQKQLDESIGK